MFKLLTIELIEIIKRGSGDTICGAKVLKNTVSD